MASFRLHLFVPQHFLSENSSHHLFGCYKIIDGHAVINCVLALPCKSKLENLCEGNPQTIDGDGLNCHFRRVGVIAFCDDSRYKTPCNIPSDSSSEVWLVILMNRRDREITVNKVVFDGKTIPNEDIYLILYNGRNIRNSELLETQLRESDVFESSFMHFLVKSVDFFMDESNLVKHKLLFNDDANLPNVLSPVEKERQPWIFPVVSNFLFLIFQCFILPFGWIYNTLSHWWPHFLKTLMIKSTFGRQAHQRMLQAHFICNQIQRKKRLDICSRNLIVAVVLDLAFGWLIAHCLQTHVSYHMMLHNMMSITNDLVNWLHELIYWLMGVPAGLKLNIPLNSALGHFFLYHIYLWQTYITIILPIFKVALMSLPFIGALGFTFVLSLLSDFIAFMTVHIYCFYGYASRLYYYQLCCLSTLWRLFRGKRWNPENQRVESYTYGVHQMYVGTLLFTVLLFLLPTVMVYYFVFATLRIAVLLVQGLLLRVIKVMTFLPVYVIALRICNSIQTTGGIRLTLVKSDTVVILEMEAIQADILSVVKKTLPPLESYEQPMSWKLLTSCLIWGKIIYPI